MPSLQYALAGQYLLDDHDDDWDEDDDDGCPAMPVLRRVGDDALYAGKTLLKDWYHVYTSPARMDWKDGLIVAATFAAGYGIYTADQEIYDEVHRFKDDAWFKPFHEIGVFFEPMGTRAFTESWYISGMLVGYITGYAPLRDISADMLESIYLSLAVQAGTKFGSSRLRPYQGDRTDWGKPKGASFISGHTANLFQLAGVVSHHFPNWMVRTGAYTVATSVALERITSTKHWPSDVYFGALWGWFVTEQMFQLKEQRNFSMQPLLTEDGSGVMLATVFTFDLR
ncbi:phosphatase PAP2 family protein [bacterium]|nr:phosphatase PAP2 family protein [bacterium]